MSKNIKIFIFALTAVFCFSTVPIKIFAAEGSEKKNKDEESIGENFDEEEFDEDDNISGPKGKSVIEFKKTEPSTKDAIKPAEPKEEKTEGIQETALQKKDAVKTTDANSQKMYKVKEDKVIERNIPSKGKKAQNPNEEIIFKVYEAKKNDTLYTVAEKFYGDPNRWEEIWDHNMYIKDPTILFPGDNIVVPMHIIKTSEDLKAEKLKDARNKKQNKPDIQIMPAGEIDFEGSIIAFKNKEYFMPTTGDIVMVDIGSEDGVVQKAIYNIYREDKDYVNRVGTIRITDDVSQNEAAALIIGCMQPIRLGDVILRKP